MNVRLIHSVSASYRKWKYNIGTVLLWTASLLNQNRLCALSSVHHGNQHSLHFETHLSLWFLPTVQGLQTRYGDFFSHISTSRLRHIRLICTEAGRVLALERSLPGWFNCRRRQRVLFVFLCQTSNKNSPSKSVNSGVIETPPLDPAWWKGMRNKADGGGVRTLDCCFAAFQGGGCAMPGVVIKHLSSRPPRDYSVKYLWITLIKWEGPALTVFVRCHSLLLLLLHRLRRGCWRQTSSDATSTALNAVHAIAFRSLFAALCNRR